MILDEIVARKRAEVARQKQEKPLHELEAALALSQAEGGSGSGSGRPGGPGGWAAAKAGDRAVAGTGPGIGRGLARALQATPRVALIAEIKQASPSRGVIRERVDVEKLAGTCAGGGASALSVLTERHYFKGDPAYIARVRRVVSLPVLRKDFIIDPYQVYESKLLGADAILLIAAVSGKKELGRLFDLASSLGLEVLAEVHNEEEMGWALELEVPVVGVNNRDLKTFRVDLETTVRLSRLVPERVTLVSESGISSRADVLKLEECGVDAVLVGEALMAAADVGAKLAELLGIQPGK